MALIFPSEAAKGKKAYHYSRLKPLVDPGHDDMNILQLASVKGCLDLVKYVVEVTGLTLSTKKYDKNALQLVREREREREREFTRE